jgi:hypothetical protein
MKAGVWSSAVGLSGCAGGLVVAGGAKAEALRLLRRRLSDIVYRTLLIDELAPTRI